MPAIQKPLLALLRAHPGGLTGNEAEPLVGVRPHAALSKLHAEGYVTRSAEREGRSFRYFLPETEQGTAPSSPSVEISARELEELRRFKAEALAKHPDLAPEDEDTAGARATLVALYEAMEGAEVMAAAMRDGTKAPAPVDVALYRAGRLSCA